MKALIRSSSRQILLGIATFASRLGGLPANISPLGSFGFFGGNPLFFGLSILLFDWFVGGFYTGFLWTYAAFAAYPLLGFLARKSTQRKLLLLPLASFLFFLVSNFGVWWHWYPHTLAGLSTCYLMALPFYVRTLLGDIGFGYGYMLFKSTRFQKILQELRHRGMRPLSTEPLFR